MGSNNGRDIAKSDAARDFLEERMEAGEDLSQFFAGELAREASKEKKMKISAHFIRVLAERRGIVLRTRRPSPKKEPVLAEDDSEPSTDLDDRDKEIRLLRSEVFAFERSLSRSADLIQRLTARVTRLENLTGVTARHELSNHPN